MGRTPRRIGFTLLELMIALAVMAVLGAITLPSFTALIDRQRLHAAVRHLQADIALARVESGRRGRPVQIHFEPASQAGAAWCYSLSTGTPPDCRHPGVTSANGVIRVVSSQEFPGITLHQADAMAVDASGAGGLINQGRLGNGLPLQRSQANFSSRGGLQLRLVLGLMGRASLCAPGAPVAHLPACPPDTSPA